MIAITNKPRAYLTQQRRECGVYVLKTLLDLYGKAPGCSPRDLLSPTARLLFGYTSPHRILKVLRRYGLEASFKRAGFRHRRLAVLRAHLEKQEPVILIVGNPYSRRRRYRHFKRWLAMHWILLLGMDEENKRVYLYDPNVRQDRHEHLPVGNVSLSYKAFLKHWRGVFLTSMLNCAYIPVRQAAPARTPPAALKASSHPAREQARTATSASSARPASYAAPPR